MTKLCVIMDSIESINPKKDSSFAIMLEAQKRDWQIFYMTIQDLYLKEGKVWGQVRQLRVVDNEQAWFQYLGESQHLHLHEHDVTLMRKDPPFDTNYLYATILLDLAKTQGHLVVNDPQSLRDANEKLFTGWFPEVCPHTLVTSKASLLKEFLLEHKKIVLKPLDSMGGESIFLLSKKDPNFNVIVETMTHHGQRPIMAQVFLSDIKKGDKRILMIDGKPFEYGLARIPQAGEFRGNLAQGGQGVGFRLSDSDYKICEKVGPVLKQKGILFAGLDVIGDKLTEINVTSPTCIREIDHIFNKNASIDIINAIVSKL